jgi:hypothetical protein
MIDLKVEMHYFLNIFVDSLNSSDIKLAVLKD